MTLETWCAYEATLAFILKRSGATPDDEAEIVALIPDEFIGQNCKRETIAKTVSRLLSGDNVMNIAHHWPAKSDGQKLGHADHTL